MYGASIIVEKQKTKKLSAILNVMFFLSQCLCMKMCLSDLLQIDKGEIYRTIFKAY